MKTSTKVIAAGAVGLAAVGVGLAGYAMMNSLPQQPQGVDDPPADPRVLPTADEVTGDLETNWGETPRDIRPLFMLMEEASQIVGSARIFSVIAFGESRWKTTAHNNDAHEVDASTRAWNNRRDKNPPLKYGEQAAAFGSGGLFGALAPYFLWTGAPDGLGRRAPLLDYKPEAMFEPRIAGFAAIVYLKRLIRNWNLVDHLDVKVGWASPSILAKIPNRQGYCEEGHQDTYCEIRAKFAHHAAEVGIDLFDQSTIPGKLDASNFPGVMAVWELMNTELVV